MREVIVTQLLIHDITRAFFLFIVVGHGHRVIEFLAFPVVDVNVLAGELVILDVIGALVVHDH